MNVIVQIWEHITNFSKEYYDFFDILINAGSLVTTIVLFYLGVKKVGEIYDEYLKRKDRALFNFYAQFDTLLSGFECLISDKSLDDNYQQNKPGDILFYIWVDPNKVDKQIYHVSADIVRLLNDEVSRFLQFFYCATDQVPPKIEKQEFEVWVDNKRELIAELNNILVATTQASYLRGGAYDEEKVRLRYNKILQLITYFREKIDDESELHRAKADKDRQEKLDL